MYRYTKNIKYTIIYYNTHLFFNGFYSKYISYLSYGKVYYYIV